MEIKERLDNLVKENDSFSYSIKGKCVTILYANNSEVLLYPDIDELNKISKIHYIDFGFDKENKKYFSIYFENSI